MSQLYQVDGKWMTVDQIHALRNKKEESVVEPIEEVVSEEEKEVLTVEDVLSVDEELPEEIMSDGVFVVSELEKCTIMELRDIAKEHGITVKGQPSKKTLINLLIQK